MGNKTSKTQARVSDSKDHRSSAFASEPRNRYSYLKRKKSPIDQGGSGTSSSSSSSASAKDNKEVKSTALAGHAGPPGGLSWNTSSSSSAPATMLVPFQHGFRYDNEEDAKSVVADVKALSGPHIEYMQFLKDKINMPLPLLMLVLEYAYLYDIIFFDLVVCPTTNVSSFSFFNCRDKRYSAEYKEAERIAREHVWTAGPLDQLTNEVKKNPNVLLPEIRITMTVSGINFTFEGNLQQLAIIFLDQTIISENPAIPITDEGQAERLMSLTQKLLSDKVSLALALEKARLAAPLEDEKVKEDKKAERLKVLNAAFDAIKQNNPAAARQIIMNHIINTKPTVITDNRYFLDLLQLVPEACNVLEKRGDKELEGGLSGDQAGQYCFATVGMINRVFLNKLRKVLSMGPYYVLYQGRNLDRGSDVSDSVFIGAAGSNSELGFSFFFGSAGPLCSSLEGVSGYVFSNLYQQLHQRGRTYAAIGHSVEEQRLDSADRRSSP